MAGTAVLLVLTSRGGPPRGMGPAQRAVPARAFVDSVGVNVHLGYYDTSYRDLALVERSLRELGIRHVRDGACAGCTRMLERMLDLGRHGVRFTLIAGDPTNRTGTLAENLGVIRSRLRGVTEAVEGPNEYDNSGDPQWAPRLRAYQRELFTRVRRDPALRELPVIGPSFVRPESRSQAGDMRAWMTLGNMHSYPGAEQPEPGVDGELDLAAEVSGPRPVVATETGYTTARAPADGRPAVPEAVAATYIPRLYLDYFRRGVRRTFLYELLDEKPDPSGRDAEQHFGLLRVDGTPKPAFTALRGLLRAIGDGAPPAPASLRYSVTGAGDDVHRLLFADRDGTRSLVLWREASVSDAGAAGASAVEDEPLTVRLGEPVGETTVLRRGARVARLSAPHDVPIRLGADPVVIRFSPT